MAEKIFTGIAMGLGFGLGMTIMVRALDKLGDLACAACDWAIEKLERRS